MALIAAALIIATAGYAAAAGTVRIIRLHSGQSVKIGNTKVVAVGKPRVVTKTVMRRRTVTGPTRTVTTTSTVTVPGPSTTVTVPGPSITVTVPGADDCASPVAYPGDDAPREAIAKWMARGARARRVPGELPVMAALVETGMRNLNSAENDSAGYFGMRKTVWNSGIYAGFPERPDLQLKWFIDQALAIWAVRVAAGDLTFGADPGRWGEWVADVTRPAQEFRFRYQLRLGEARALIGASCSNAL